MHSYPRHSATPRPLIIARPALDKIHFIRDDSQSALCTAANRAYMPFQMFIVQLSSYNTPVEWRTAVENLNMFLLCWQSTLQPAQPSCPLLYDVGRTPSNSETLIKCNADKSDTGCIDIMMLGLVFRKTNKTIFIFVRC